jgi:hypothetical protein
MPKKIPILIILVLMAVQAGAQVKNTKRGIAYGHHSQEDLQSISASLSWWYNWSHLPETAVAGVYGQYDMDFVPMAWNGKYNTATLRSFYSSHPEARYLLGFNEPNFLEQANMTPSEAAAAWPGLEAIADEFGLELVGPAVNWCGSCVSEGGVTFTNPYAYLDAFFEACADCRVDYIAVHNYMCYAGALGEYLDGFRKYGKKIWLTEFACWDQQNITLDMQKNLVIGTLDLLDNDTLIFRYSWFTGRSGEGTPHIDLFGSQPGELSELGELYVDYNPVHDTGVYVRVPARIEAENYAAMSGIALEGTSDYDGLVNVGWIDAGDWLEYHIDPAEEGLYHIYLRIAATTATSVDLLVDDTLAGTVAITSTGGWQNWKNFHGQVNLGPGKNRLRLSTPTGSFNINWLVVSANENHPPVISAGEDIQVSYPGETAALLAGEVSDPDGDSLQVGWTRVSGAECTIEAPGMPQTTVSGLEPGNYYFRLTVSDGIERLTDMVRVSVTDVTGVGSMPAGEIVLYPNPASHILVLKIPVADGHLALRVMSPDGRVLLSTRAELHEGETKIDVSGLPEGLYFLEAVSDHFAGVTSFFRADP